MKLGSAPGLGKRRDREVLVASLFSFEAWRVVADNFLLRIEGDGVTHETVNAERESIVAENVIEGADLWRPLATPIPEYRLSY